MTKEEFIKKHIGLVCDCQNCQDNLDLIKSDLDSVISQAIAEHDVYRYQPQPLPENIDEIHGNVVIVRKEVMYER